MRTGFTIRARLAAATAFLAAALTATVLAASSSAGGDNAYTVHNLVSDGSATADNVDSNLVNGWGLVSGPTTPWWVADNGTDLSTLYNAAGTPFPQPNPLVVTVVGGPTGVVFNGTTGAFPAGGTANARFIFATEGGTIQAFTGTTTATVEVNDSAARDVFKGLAIATTPTGSPQLYATDFHNARVDVFDASWQPVATAGGFVDPNLPARYAPFGIQTIGDRIFVTYGKQDAVGHDELDGQGLGFVDAYDTSGNLLARVAQHGQLNGPWGLALAPASFGKFGGDLLVGNFGDGQINAYEEQPNGHFEHRGTLQSTDGGKLAIDGLWSLQFGHGAANNGSTNTLFFTAGPNGESDGLFGTITAG
jgi:uncharacterized protein (TIGR03118 family)